MTTRGVHQFVLGIYKKLNLTETEISKFQTGGPDGDLGSNEIKISSDKTVAIVDGSGVLYDPTGLDRAELIRLADARKMSEHFNKALLSSKGFFIHINDVDVQLPDGRFIEKGLIFRNNFHLDEILNGVELFVPCGGRPAVVNSSNVQQLWSAELGRPRFRYIVEGANLFFTHEARLKLEEWGVILFKDASAGAEKCLTVKFMEEFDGKKYKDPYTEVLNFLVLAGFVERRLIRNRNEFFLLNKDLSTAPNLAEDCRYWVVPWLAQWQKTRLGKYDKNKMKKSNAKPPRDLGMIGNKQSYFELVLHKMLDCLTDLGIVVKVEKKNYCWKTDYQQERFKLFLEVPISDEEHKLWKNKQQETINTLVSEIRATPEWPKGFHDEAIIRWILSKVFDAGEFKTRFPKSFKVIMEEQPFSWFRDGAEFSNSWLDKLFHIANDSKHVRLTPINADRDHGNYKGFLREYKTRFEIEYCEPLPQLYSWSLYNMTSMARITDDTQRKQVSRLAREFLKGPDGAPPTYFEHRTWRKNGLEYYRITDKVMQIINNGSLQEHLKTDLESNRDLEEYLQKHPELNFEDIAQSIQKFIETRAERQSPSVSDPCLTPDFKVDFFWLLENSLARVTRISETLFQELGWIDRSMNEYLIDSHIPSKYYCASEIAAKDNHEELQKVMHELRQLFPTRPVMNGVIEDSSEDVTPFYIGLILRQSHLLFVSGDAFTAAERLKNLANQVEEQRGWLYFYLIKRALGYLKVWNGCTIEAFALEYKMIGYLIKRNFRSKVALLLPGLKATYNNVKFPPSSLELANSVPFIELQNKIETGIIDKDIFLQLEKFKFDLEKLKWLGVKLRTNTDKLALVKGICTAAQAVIKLRNLLDQSFTRFVRRCITKPNNQCCFNLQIPSCAYKSLLKSQFCARLKSVLQSCPSGKHWLGELLRTPLALGTEAKAKLDHAFQSLVKSAVPDNEQMLKFRMKLLKQIFNQKLDDLYKDCQMNPDSKSMGCSLSFKDYPEVIKHLVLMYDILHTVHEVSNTSKHVKLHFPTKEDLENFFHANRDISALPFFCHQKWEDICYILDQGVEESEQFVLFLFCFAGRNPINHPFLKICRCCDNFYSFPFRLTFSKKIKWSW